MSFSKNIFIMLTLAHIFVVPSIIHATIIGVSYSYPDSPVVTIDETSGVFAEVGLSGFPCLNSMACDSSGIFYSVVNGRTSGCIPYLVTIDPRTGAGTLISMLNFGEVTPDVRGIAFSSHNVLFAINNTGPAGGLNRKDLYTIDMSSGIGSFVGVMGFAGIQGLDFSPSGTLYGWDVKYGLLTINSLTGVATDVNPQMGGAGDIQTIVFAPDGTLYGACHALYTIDIETGAYTLIGGGDYFDVRGIEFIPEPSILLFLGLGSLIIRRLKFKKLNPLEACQRRAAVAKERQSERPVF